jgi:hypothetical protein
MKESNIKGSFTAKHYVWMYAWMLAVLLSQQVVLGFRITGSKTVAEVASG